MLHIIGCILGAVEKADPKSEYMQELVQAMDKAKQEYEEAKRAVEMEKVRLEYYNNRYYRDYSQSISKALFGFDLF